MVLDRSRRTTILAGMVTKISDRPVVRLKPKAQKRLKLGHPWAFSNEIEMTAEAKALAPGSLVRLDTSDGEPLGTFLFNRHPLIAARLLSRDHQAQIDAGFFRQRLERALQIRERLIGVPFYRLAHAESDGLPGTIIDRFGDALVLQVNSAGMEALTPLLLDAVDDLIAPTTLMLRNDSPVRSLERLEPYVSLVRGTVDKPFEIVEHRARFFADLGEGQKTGWFYDQRDNRRWAAELVQGLGNARVLDAYCFAGGFSIQAALAGAAEVTGLDRSARALELAKEAAALNDVEDRCSFRRTDVFAALEHLAKKQEAYQLVIADPPAFVKNRKDLPQGLRAYRKLARLAAGVTEQGGYLVLCSCSHHVDPASFLDQIGRGVAEAGRSASVLRQAGAALDHPVHPRLPETQYLKAVFLALD